VRAFFKKIELEGAGSLNLDFLCSIEAILADEVHNDKVHPYQKEVDFLQNNSTQLL
jgi:hypothetical protein